MNKNLLSYVSVAELIARTFPNAEVVLHDLSKPQHSVVYVANNSVTGRKVGQTFHHLIEKAVFAGNPADGVVAATMPGSWHALGLVLDDGMELLSNLIPGERNSKGQFPTGSVNKLVEDGLKKLYSHANKS